LTFVAANRDFLRDRGDVVRVENAAIRAMPVDAIERMRSFAPADSVFFDVHVTRNRPS